ncbi:MAG: hypothetical protein ABI867_06200 [Kofleriaceae bacterium]
MLDRRILPAIATAIPFVLVALGYLVTRPATAWIGSFELVVSGGLLVCAVATALATYTRSRRLGIGVAAFLLTANTAFVVGSVFGWKPIPTQGFASDKFAIVLAAGTMLGVVGLVARRQWARWLALALGAAGIGCGVLNAINYWSISQTPYAGDLAWFLDMCRVEWVHLVTAAGGALIVTNLVATRAAFTAPATWNQPDPVVRALRLSMIAAFVAVPMLLVYAWMQPIVPATATTAVVLAAALTVAATLAIRGKVAGALLLVLSGAGLLAQTIATAVLAEGPQQGVVTGYYAFFWVPAAVLALVTGALMVRPTLRLLRS